MGIKNLWPKLNEYAQETSLQNLHESVLGKGETTTVTTTQKIQQIRLGIDISFWMNHRKTSWNTYYEKDNKIKPNLIIRTIFYRLCKLSAIPNILPIFVFDGLSRPDKRGIERTSSGLLFGQLEVEVKEIIQAFGFPILQAPGEAEAELADLNKRGLLDAILSDDGDCFMFGAKVVVRNWGEKLGGNVAYRSRKANHQKKKKKELPKTRSDSSSGDLLSSSEEEEEEEENEEEEDVFQVKKSSQSTEDQKAIKPTDQITFYRIEDFAKGVNAASCMLLIVLLGGGDYDAEGVRQCGIQTAVGLAKVGFDRRLLEGVKEHLRPSTTAGHPPELISKTRWETFIQDWKEDVKHELITNSSGKLGRRYPALAKSKAFSNLFSTPNSLTTLAVYVWPTISGRSFIPTQKPIDIEKVALVAGKLLRWNRNFGIKTMRNTFFVGCISQWLLNYPIAGLPLLNKDDKGKEKPEEAFLPPPSPTPLSKSSQSPKKDKKQKYHGQDIRSMFSTAAKSTKEKVDRENVTPYPNSTRVILEVIKERSSELYIECAVTSLVALAEAALIDGLSRRELIGQSDIKGFSEEDELESSTQSESNASASNLTPSKPKKPFNPNDPIRVWMKKDILLTHREGREQYEEFRNKKEQRDRMNQEKQNRQEKIKASQRSQQTLSSFFRSEKQIVGKKISGKGKEKDKTTTIQNLESSSPSKSPSKRRAKKTPYASSETFSLSSEEADGEGEETILAIAKDETPRKFSAIQTKVNKTLFASDDSVEFVSIQRKEVDKSGEGEYSSKAQCKYVQAIEILD